MEMTFFYKITIEPRIDVHVCFYLNSNKKPCKFKRCYVTNNHPSLCTGLGEGVMCYQAPWVGGWVCIVMDDLTLCPGGP